MSGIKILSAAAAFVTFAVFGTVLASAEYGDLPILDDYGAVSAEAESEMLSFNSYTSGDYTYALSGDSVRITGYTGSATNLTIPSTLAGKTVTGIDDYAFKHRNTLTSVTIPSSVTYMGGYVFDSCKNLKSVTFSNGITEIGCGAFSGCSALTSVNLPDSVTTIDGYAFYRCTSLKSITIPSKVSSMGSCTFYGCSSLTEIKIPRNVTFIGSASFSCCSSLKSIDVDDGNTKYSSSNGVLFCKAMTEIVAYPGGKSGSYVIPSGVISIGKYAFAGCYNLTDVSIHNNVSAIGNYAFLGCNGLTIHGFDGSYAQEYANNNDISFESIKAEFTSDVKTTAGNRSVTLSWDEVVGATGYIVKSADGKTKYTSSAITDSSYTVKNLKNGVKYQFKVYAYVNGKWCGSAAVSRTPVAKPENVVATADNKRVKLSWDKVDNATGYIVKSADGKTQYTQKAISSNSYTVTGLTNGTQYKFKVYAYSDGKWFASYTVTKTPSAAPQNVKATAESKKITLSWNKVNGATGYVIKSADGKTQYTKKAITSNSHTLTGLTAGKQYKFKVYACVNGKWYASNTITRTAKK